MLQIILVGAGHRGKEHLLKWPKLDAKVVAVVDANPALVLPDIAQQARRFPTLEEAIQACPDALLVDICTPPDSHKAFVIQALKHDLHVLCEKPFVLDLAEAAEIERAAADSQGRVVLMHNWLAMPGLKELREQVAAGAFGEVFAANCVWLEDHRHDSQGITNPKHWVHELAGGRLEETLPHLIYSLMSLMRDTSLSVRSAVFSKRTSYEWVKADTVAVILEGQKGTASLYLTFGSDRVHTTFSVVGTRGSGDACLDTRLAERVGLRYGNTGKMDPVERLFRLCEGIAHRAVTAAVHSVRTLRRSWETGDNWLMQEVIRSIEQGTPPPVTLAEAIATVRLTREICDQLREDKATINAA